MAFTAKEGNRLVGKLARLAAGCVEVFKLLSHLYTLIAFALGENRKYLLDTSAEFRALKESIDRRKFCS